LTLARIRSFKSQNYKVILYAPTFRDMDSGFRYADAIDYALFNRFLEEQRLILVIKGHTSMARGELAEFYSHILFYQNECDGYPLLKETDLLITDYSSIYMDFLHSKKPVLFFVYDYEEYIGKHREIQFDYLTMTPGPKARNYEELKQWVHHFLVLGQDGFLADRERVSTLAFAYMDGFSSHRLVREMQKRRMIV
jgi:CDP-glycerol glycerophosphotransferase (TagB/SpsB family)